MKKTRSRIISPKVFLFGVQILCLFTPFALLFVETPPLYFTGFLFALAIAATGVAAKTNFKAEADNYKGIYPSIFFLIGLVGLIIICLICAFCLFVPLIYFAMAFRACVYVVSVVAVIEGIAGLIKSRKESNRWISVYTLAVTIIYMFSVTVSYLQTVDTLSKELIILWAVHICISAFIGTMEILWILRKRKS